MPQFCYCLAIWTWILSIGKRIASVEQAQQLIENPTSTADLDLGEQKVKEAQKHLDALPIGFLNDSPEYRYWWYGSRFSIYGFNAARTKVGQLEAKVFQQKNAQTLLTDNEQAVFQAKQQYQQASTPIDKQAAIASWRSAIDQLKQIPSQTLAGKTAQKKLDAYQYEFKEVVGLAAGNERISTLIEAARQFSWQAAKAGQNPPHAVTEWQQVEYLWQQAISRLEQISKEDLAGYAEAQKLLAQYNSNLGQVKYESKLNRMLLTPWNAHNAKFKICCCILLLLMPSLKTATVLLADYRELSMNWKGCKTAQLLI
jgi:hypothetical protein